MVLAKQYESRDKNEKTLPDYYKPKVRSIQRTLAGAIGSLA